MIDKREEWGVSIGKVGSEVDRKVEGHLNRSVETW